MLQTVKNPLRAKSYEFALAIVNLYKRLQSDQREYVLSKQLLRSATSVGANVEEAQQAQSRRDFILKTSIAMKEAYESRYWLRLLQDGGYVPKEKNQKYLQQAEEVIALLGTSIQTARNNLNS